MGALATAWLSTQVQNQAWPSVPLKETARTGSAVIAFRLQCAQGVLRRAMRVNASLRTERAKPRERSKVRTRRRGKARTRRNEQREKTKRARRALERISKRQDHPSQLLRSDFRSLHIFKVIFDLLQYLLFGDGLTACIENASTASMCTNVCISHCARQPPGGASSRSL